MSWLKQFVSGVMLPVAAASLLFRGRGLKRFAMLPLLVNCLLYIAVLACAIWALLHFDLVRFHWTFWGPVGPWLAGGVNWLVDVLGVVVGVVLLLLGAYLSFTTMGMVVASPFNDILSERVERLLCGGDAGADIPLALTIKGTLYSIWGSLVIGLTQVVCALLVLPLILVPVVGFVPLFVVNAYFTGLGFFDVGMARNLLGMRHKRAMLRERRWQVLGMGVGMQLLFMIPLAGLLMLPLGVTAGTMLYCDCDWVGVLKARGLPLPPGFYPPQGKTRKFH